MCGEMIYEPDCHDGNRWEHTMFQMKNAPPKLPSWQDYFVRIQKGEDCFPEFLHHYEPVLNKLAKGFVNIYGLQGHFADIKMAYVETMLTELKTYDPSEGVDFLIAIKRKLNASLHAYAMANLKGFSETSATHYYQLRKAAYISKSFPKDTVIPIICEQLNIQPKTTMCLLGEVYALDTFQWFGSGETEDGLEDIPVGIDILGHCRTPQPEQALLHKETVQALHLAFEKLNYKDRDIISRHLGFYKVCFRPLRPNTFEELADLYQYSTADGIMRYYHRALDRLRGLLEEET